MRITELNRNAGMLGMRLILGLTFLFQGYGKVFSIGIHKIYQGFFLEQFHDTFLPEWLLKFTAYYTSFIELIAGFLLVIGFFKPLALYALLSVLIIVSFGHGLVEPIWDLHHVYFRAALLLSILFLPDEWDQWSFDRVLINKYLIV